MAQKQKKNPVIKYTKTEKKNRNLRGRHLVKKMFPCGTVIDKRVV